MESEKSDGSVVLRLLTRDDIDGNLVNKSVYTLWPENNTWYRGEVESCVPETSMVTLFYRGTLEREEANLLELIGDGQVAFKEERDGPGYVCVDGEIMVGSDVVIDEGEGDAGDTSDEDYVGSDQDDVMLSHRSRRIRAKRVYDEYIDEDAFFDEGEEDDAPLAGRSRVAAFTASKAKAVRELAERRKKREKSEKIAQRGASKKGGKEGSVTAADQRVVRRKFVGCWSKGFERRQRVCPRARRWTMLACQRWLRARFIDSLGTRCRKNIRKKLSH
jgi:hypothetical protein